MCGVRTPARVNAPAFAACGGVLTPRARAQAKLEHYLPAATDSVLCDYVLVMVGNKKTSRQVALDLEAFLGPDEAEEFVTWLWELLSSVENGTLDLSGEAAPPAAAPAAEPKREERRSRSPPRRDDRRRSRSREGARSKNYSSHARSRSRSRERGGDRRHDDGRRGGRMGQDARRRDEYDDRDWGYNRGGRQGQGGGGGGGVPADDRRGLRAVCFPARARRAMRRRASGLGMLCCVVPRRAILLLRLCGS